jgi:hypothetical protein
MAQRAQATKGRANPFVRTDAAYVKGAQYWREPFLGEFPNGIKPPFETYVNATDERKAVLLDSLYRFGNSPEMTAAIFGWTVDEMDLWISAQGAEVWARVAANHKARHSNRNQAARNRKEDPVYRLRANFSSRVWSALRRKKPGPVFDVLEYTLDDLVAHLESQFVDGMNWGNYGRRWHVDHKKPISRFDWNGDDIMSVFRECWALSNLQPLWGEDNVRKSNRYDET